MTKIKVFLVIFIVSAGFVLRLLLLPSHYMFEWDQNRDAVEVMKMINRHQPSLIGPVVSSENGFFTSPWHYYFLTPFYLLTQGDPIAGGLAALVVWLITCITIFIISLHIFGYNTAIIAILFTSLNPNLVSWNAMYLPISALVIFYLCYLLVKQSSVKLFYIICLVFGLSFTTQIVPISLAVPILLAIRLSNLKLKPKNIFFGLFLIFLFISPLIIFDIRHQFLNFHKIIEFISGNTSESSSIFLRTFWRSLTIFNWQNKLLEQFFWLTVFFISPFVLFKSGHRKLILVWWATPLLALSLYHGNIPEYYYSMITSLLPLFLAAIISKLKPVMIRLFIFGFIVFLSLPSTLSTSPTIGLAAKKKIVQYFKSNLSSLPFNVSYDFPIGQNNGYNYLFQYYRLTPQESAPLYTIHPTSLNVSGSRIYQSEDGLAITKR